MNLFADSQDDLYLGQKNFTHYFDVYDPEILKGKTSDQVIFKDDKKKDDYLNNAISNEFLVEKEKLLKDINTSLDCSNKDLARIYSYYRYAHRLLSLSYLYEAFIDYDLTLKKLGEDPTCMDKFKLKLKSCSAKTKDMKVFLSNLENFVKFQPKEYLDSRFSVKSFRKDFFSGFSANKFNLLHYRLDSANSSNLKKKISSVCSEDLESFGLICNEEDSLFGMSRVYETYDLLTNSSVFNFFKYKININGCLRRFKKTFSSKELRYQNLREIFPYLFEQLKETNSREGRVFALGTLKEFIQKGLSLFNKKEDQPKEVKKEKPKVLEPQVKKIEPEEIKKLAKTKPVETKVKEKSKKKARPIVKTAFLEAQEFATQRALSSYPVDMDKFKYDYVIPLGIKEKLDSSLAIFLKQSSLKIMKDNEGLGSKNGAIPLILLKYMIDYDKHVELYNIVNVVGEDFFVMNDIDQLASDSPTKIKLLNNVKSNYRWQIYIIDK